MKLRLVPVLIVAAAVLASPAAGSSTAARWFTTPDKSVSCELGLNRRAAHPATYVFCLAYKAGRPYSTARAVTMKTSARLKVCRGLRCVGNTPDSSPTLKVGHSIGLGPFRCTSLSTGVRCVVTKLGHGFRLSTSSLKRV